MQLLAAILFALAALALPAAAQPVHTANVEAELHSARAAAAPGERVQLVLRQRIRDGWHTYWRNPGDSGEPTEITFALPAGYAAGELQFPAPERIPVATLVNYGFAGEVLFPIELTVPADARPGETAQLAAHATWLVCSDICIPEEADFTLALPIAAAGADDPSWKPRIDAAVAALPRSAAIEGRVTATGEGAVLTLAGDILTGARAPHFFPFSADAIDHAADEDARVGTRGVSLALKPGAAGDLGEVPLEGVLTVEQRAGDGWTRRAYEVRAEPGPPLPGTGNRAANAEGAALGIPLALLFAFAGGLILNVMPCVFPVLSLKALSLARAEPGEARRDGLLFLAGVVVTFLTLAGALIALKAGGEAVGWGFQLQVPLVVAALSTLFFVIGLNLAGAFDIGGSVQNFGGGIAARGGAFFTGALAVIAAAPCTAPFMASALGYAVTQSAPVTLAIFLALALGFAAPFAALSFAPALRRGLPKPGVWMERAKTVLAFPMFGAAVWLAWVLTAQTGPGGLLALLALFVAIGFLVAVARWGVGWRIAGAAVVLGAVLYAVQPLRAPQPVQEAALSDEAWSPARVEALLGEGRGVFVDFTAAWCITCQANKITTLNRPRVRTAFDDNDVTFLTADWTNPDPVIAAALAEHGRDGVPLYLYYPPGERTPRVLPQTLTEAIVLDALAQKGDTS